MKLIKFESSTHTSEEAAKVLDCALSQIIKTLVFHFRDTYFIVILPGDSKLNYVPVKKLLDIGRPSMATAQKVFEITGSPIGGVKPIFRTNLKVLMDKKIMQFDTVYGGGGDSYTMMEVTPQEVIAEMNPIIWDISL